MSSHQELLDLAETVVLGTLAAEDRARLDAHLAEGCEECEAVMRSATALADELAAAISPMDVSPGVREQLVDRVRADARPQAVATIRWQSYALAASLIAALVLGVRLFEVSGELEEERMARAEVVTDYETDRTDLRRALAQLDVEARDRARMELELASLRGTVQTLTAATTRAVPLAGQGPTPDASARAYLDPESRRPILYVYDLAAAPAGKSYQLWVIADGQPVSAGVLDLGPQGEARHDTVAKSTLEGGVTIAITLEPAGGREQPTGPIVLAGN